MTEEESRRLAAAVKVREGGVVEVRTAPSTINAADFDFRIEKGRTFRLPITWYSGQEAPKALAAFTAALVAWKAWGDATPVLSLTNGAGITLGDEDQNIILDVPVADVNALDFLRAVYTLTLTGGGVSTRLLSGTIILA